MSAHSFAIPVGKGPPPPAPLLLRLAFKPVCWSIGLARLVSRFWRSA
jgi:hypothetical protein